MTWAMRQTVGGATGKLILLALAEYADEHGRCFPGQDLIAARCELKARSVREWLSKLQKDGFLVRHERRLEGGYKTSDEIVLALESPAQDAAEISPAPGSPELDAAEISPAFNAILT